MSHNTWQNITKKKYKNKIKSVGGGGGGESSLFAMSDL